jgi:hypothetical protein
LHLQQAADRARETLPEFETSTGALVQPIADWFDRMANNLAAWAPYRDHEGGYKYWQMATRMAHAALDLEVEADVCSVCHTHTWPGPPSPLKEESR